MSVKTLHQNKTHRLQCEPKAAYLPYFWEEYHGEWIYSGRGFSSKNNAIEYGEKKGWIVEKSV